MHGIRLSLYEVTVLFGLYILIKIEKLLLVFFVCLQKLFVAWNDSVIRTEMPSELLTEHVSIDCEEDLSTIIPYGFSRGRNDPVTAEQ